MFLGPLKVAISLVLFTIYQTFRSAHPNHTAAKVLTNCLALILFFWVGESIAADKSSTFKVFLLENAPATTFAKLFLGGLSAVLTYGAFRLLEFVAIESQNHGVVQAMTVFVSTLILCVLISTMLSHKHVEEPAAVNQYQISVGIIVGSLLFMIAFLFRYSKDNASHSALIARSSSHEEKSGKRS